MIRFTTLTLLSLALIMAMASLPARVAVAGSAEEGCESCPTTTADTTTAAKELPQGHPPLPQGHPELPKGHPELPKGHPELPQGHPQISPTGQPFQANLMIKAVQGTKDGPAVGDVDVTVEFYQGNRPVAQRQTRLDQHGVVMLEGVELNAAVRALVTIQYAGVEYRGVSNPLSAEQPDQMVRVTVFETTEQAPAWDIAMRHVMVHRVSEGLQVTEVLSIRNPTDRTWLGTLAQPAAGEKASRDVPVAGEKDGHETRLTFELPLPAEAAEVQLGQGFHGCCTRIENGRIINTMPVLPGAQQYRFGYLLPVRNGQARIDLPVPAPVAQMMVFLPEDGATVTAEGVQFQQTMTMGDKPIRVYAAHNLAAASKVALGISGMRAAMGEGASSQAVMEPQSPVGAKAVAGLGAVGLLVVGLVVVFAKSPKKSGSGR